MRIRTPDWTKLTAEFDYLAGAAERYGELMALCRPLRRRLKRSEVEELRELAPKIGWRNHDLPLQSWLIQHSIAGHHDEVELVEGLLNLLEHLGLDISDYGPKQEPQWTLHLWDTLHYNVLKGRADELRDVVSDPQAFDVAVATLRRVPSEDLSDVAFWMLHPFQTSRALDWIESHASAIDADDLEAFSLRDWGHLAALSEFSWPRAQSWLDLCRPLSLVALIALTDMGEASRSPIVREAAPRLLDPARFDVAAKLLGDYASQDRDPWVRDAVGRILERWADIIDPSQAD